MLSRKFFNPVPNRHFVVGILMLSTSFVLTTVHDYFPLSANWSLFRLPEWSSPANCSFNGVFDFFVFGRQRGVPQPRSQSFSLLVGGRPPREGKSPGNEVPILVINYHVHMIPIQRVNIWVLLERCLILNNLYFKRVTPITMKYSP